MSDEPLIFPLSKKITAHGEEKTELSFRAPTGGDILVVGNPVIMDMGSQPPRVTHDERKMAGMMARLGEIPPSSIAQMAPEDLVGCFWLLTPFFIPPLGRI